MNRKVFAIILVQDGSNSEIETQISNHYSASDYLFKYADNTWLVVGSQGETAESVATNVGLKGENRIDEASGVVFKLNAGYAGYTRKDLWEWLASVETI